MTEPVKILTVGPALGSIRDLFAKVKAIDAKHGKFDFMLCVGDFFGPLDSEGEPKNDVIELLEGKLDAPIQCYVVQGRIPLSQKVVERFAQKSGEISKNVFLMNKSGIITTANGLRIACLGGTYNADIYSNAEAAPGFLSPYFSTHTIERLQSNSMVKSYSKQDYKSLATIQSTASSSQLIDILLTNVWASCITQHSTLISPEHSQSSVYAPPLDEVIRKSKPRYHFTTDGTQMPRFWEREPFTWEEEDDRVSRFVSLGAFGEEPTVGKRQRWFYAFSITPIPSSTFLPKNVTKNPFHEMDYRTAKRALGSFEGENFIFGSVPQPSKRHKTMPAEPGKPPPGYKCRRCESTEHFINDCPERVKPPEGYVCKICNTPGHLVRDCPTRDAVGDTGGRKPKPGYVCRACGSEQHYLDDCLIANQRFGERHAGRRKAVKEIGPEECWFCLSNPSLAKHLIVSIGSECYLTLPKGQIIPTQTAAERVDVPGGGHVLIVPITHYPTYTTMPHDLAIPIMKETQKYKEALRAMYAKHKSAMVLFEVGRLSAKGGHAHVQAVPIPLHLKDKVEDAFLSEGRNQGVDFEADPEAAMQMCAGGALSYFRVDLPDGRKMVHLMKDTVPFSIQFGRQVLVSLLGMPERLDWKSCALSEDEDKTDAQAFKVAFAPFDPCG